MHVFLIFIIYATSLASASISASLFPGLVNITAVQCSRDDHCLNKQLVSSEDRFDRIVVLTDRHKFTQR